MTKVTVTFEGDHESIRGDIATFLRLAEHQIIGTQPIVEESLGQAGWTEPDITRFWHRLTDGARWVLAEIVKQPSGYPFDELQEALGIDGVGIGARLSSMGHNMKHFPGKPPLVERDWRSRRYMMDPKVAEVVRKLAEQEGVSA